MDEEKIGEHAATIGTKPLSRLSALKEQYEMIADVRGKELIIGIEFRSPAALGLKTAWLAVEAAERGLFT